ncbi:10858_t:CDS:2 [Ambispora gerdemannii]|uniref:10858_t:CDS:1 n=1 Tax=Ambispora gerdemannii TaxID=144530 RepID=A0A9N8WH08_9GLOM|nr:10858_t:CDS:2 [Ambispora gerdemannii]
MPEDGDHFGNNVCEKCEKPNMEFTDDQNNSIDNSTDEALEIEIETPTKPQVSNESGSKAKENVSSVTQKVADVNLGFDVTRRRKAQGILNNWKILFTDDWSASVKKVYKPHQIHNRIRIVRVKQQLDAIKNSADQVDTFQKQFVDDSRKRTPDNDDLTDEETLMKKVRFGAEAKDDSGNDELQTSPLVNNETLTSPQSSSPELNDQNENSSNKFIKTFTDGTPLTVAEFDMNKFRKELNGNLYKLLNDNLNENIRGEFQNVKRDIKKIRRQMEKIDNTVKS